MKLVPNFLESCTLPPHQYNSIKNCIIFFFIFKVFLRRDYIIAINVIIAKMSPTKNLSYAANRIKIYKIIAEISTMSQVLILFLARQVCIARE
jgi:hypothetical protein